MKGEMMSKTLVKSQFMVNSLSEEDIEVMSSTISVDLDTMFRRIKNYGTETSEAPYFRHMSDKELFDNINHIMISTGKLFMDIYDVYHVVSIIPYMKDNRTYVVHSLDKTNEHIMYVTEEMLWLV